MEFNYDVYNTYKAKLINYIAKNPLYSQNDHDKEHMLRVLFLTIKLSEYYNLDDKQKEILYTAAAFHDIGRINDDVDEIHGENSYKKLIKYDKSYKNDLFKRLMTYHCISDKKASFLDDELILYKILKDSDALDRMRFGIFFLDISRLRLKESIEMLELAMELINGNDFL